MNKINLYSKQLYELAWEKPRFRLLFPDLLMKFLFNFLWLLCISIFSLAQADSSKTLQEVTVRGFETRQTPLQTPASVSRISGEEIGRHALSDPLPVFNSQAGIRMEERSPGSYRLTLRGSSLRSPFGVRNVKIYWNGIPMSDANGTTYFNQVDFNALGSIEVLKGPAGSIFGAGYGGVVQLNTPTAAPGHEFSGSFQGGSYASFAGNARYQYASQRMNLVAAFSGRGSDGYRHHAGMSGYNGLFSGAFFLNAGHTLTFSYSGAHIDYRTPGGLTLAQMETDRQASRPATATLPSASQQNAGIVQTYHLAGVTHEWKASPKTSLTTTLFYAGNDLTNPFITSYEQRDENTRGYRLLGRSVQGRLILYAGSEGIFTSSGFYVSQNNAGQKGAFLYDTDLLSHQLSHFVQAQVSLPGHVEITGGLSYNTQLYRNETIGANGETLYVKEKPGLPWSPRIAVLKSLNAKTGIFYTFSNGYSPPTAQEMTANFENRQNVNLLAEKGVSHEIGLKSQWTAAFRTEIAAYHQVVRNALVRQVLDNGSEYFQNTGRIIQKGLEISNRLTLENKERYIRTTDLLLNLALNNFRFGSYWNEGTDLRGKRLPGAPGASVAFSGKWVQRKGVYLTADVNYISAMYLNNTNTLRSEGYTTTRLRAGWKLPIGDRARVNFYGGADNLLNEKYSLGFDFNAIGARFYNPAPLRNFHAGAGITLKFR